MNEEAGASPFDAIRHENDGGEYWSARELSEALSYTEVAQLQQGRHASANSL